MKKIDTEIKVVVGLILLTTIVVGISMHGESKFEKSCIEKGGDYHYSRNGSLCLKKGSIIDSE